MLSKPLTNLLRAGEFQWNEHVQGAFEPLKRALSQAPVLTLPDFTKTFIVETDTSNGGIGVVLMQGNHPISFISRSLGPKWQQLSIYEKELLARVFAVQK